VSFVEYLVPTAGSNPAGITNRARSQRMVHGALWQQNRKITPSGVVTEYPIPTSGSRPGVITLGLMAICGSQKKASTIFLVGNKIGRITPAGVITEFQVPTDAVGPSASLWARMGNLWFTEGNANKIGRITTTGVVTEFPIPLLAASRSLSPQS